MRTPSNTTKRLACLGIAAIIVVVLLLFTLLFIGLFTGRIPTKLFMPVYMLAFGVGWLIAGIRKFRGRRASGERVSWYMQPGILLAMAAFLIVPPEIVVYITNGNFPNGDAILISLFIPSFLLFIIATYFAIRRFTHPFEDL